MSKQDYHKFLNKVDQLNKLVETINHSPDKYELFIKCKTHKQVVELAKKWGFEIGNRWGDY